MPVRDAIKHIDMVAMQLASNAEVSQHIAEATLDERRVGYAEGIFYALAVLTGLRVDDIREHAQNDTLLTGVSDGSLLIMIQYIMEL